MHVPASWQLLAKAALVFGGTRNTPEVMHARRALLQRCLADLLERTPELLLQPELLTFLGLSRSDLPEPYVAWAEQLQASGGAALVATKQACVASAAANTQAGARSCGLQRVCAGQRECAGCLCLIVGSVAALAIACFGM